MKDNYFTVQRICFLLLAGVFVFFSPARVHAQIAATPEQIAAIEGACFCYIEDPGKPGEASGEPVQIAELQSESDCVDQSTASGVLLGCSWRTDAATQSDTSAENSSTAKPVNAAIDISSYNRPAGYAGPLPDCAFTGTCRNVNDLLQLVINIGTFALGIIGSLAFVFFVYGGFMMILSMGHSERVKKGKDILVAAIVGLIIAFSAYALISFILDVVGVSSQFRIIK